MAGSKFRRGFSKGPRQTVTVRISGALKAALDVAAKEAQMTVNDFASEALDNAVTRWRGFSL